MNDILIAYLIVGVVGLILVGGVAFALVKIYKRYGR